MDTNYLFIGDICKLESITTTLGNSVNHLNDLSLESYINEEIKQQFFTEWVQLIKYI